MPLEIKPSKGMKVKVNAKREAVFGDESVSISKVTLSGDGSSMGVLTGVTLAGYCEVEMPNLDGKRHWYPIGELNGEKGEQLVEEEIKIEEVGEDDEEEE